MKTVKMVKSRMKRESVRIEQERPSPSPDVLYLRIKVSQITSCFGRDDDHPPMYESENQRCVPVSARLLRGEDKDEDEEDELAEVKAEQALSSILFEMEFTPQRYATSHGRLVHKIFSASRSSDWIAVPGTVQVIVVQVLICVVLSSDLIERVILEGTEKDDEEDRCCTIFLEKLPIGQSVMRMACRHVYHTPCILRWLQTSNFCPLCRFRCPFFDG